MLGFLLVDKPGGCTSHDVVHRVRRTLGGLRVGHAGTLDPLATGLLVCGVGQATRALGVLQHDRKTYDGCMRLGMVTDTQDITGAVVDQIDGVRLDRRVIALAAEQFLGPIKQTPPLYSAVKLDGVPLHRRMRRGLAVTPPPPRPVEIVALEVLAVEGAEVRFRVTCSSGTYVRTLCQDWGAALRVGGCLAALRRIRSGPFDLADAHPLEALDSADAVAAALLPVGAGLADWPRRVCTPPEVEAARHGRPLPGEGWTPDTRLCLTLESGDVFALAVARMNEEALVLKASPVFTDVLDPLCPPET